MTKSRSDTPEIRRQWSVLPVRALLDRKMTISEFKVLAALCVFTNSYGVCWPGVKTIGEITNIDPGNVSRLITKLVRRGYVRRLLAKDFQKQYAQFGRINRYQVLYAPDAPLPTWEEIQTSLVLAPASEVPNTHNNDKGSGDQAALESVAYTLAVAFARAVEARLGQPREPGNEMGHARKLATSGVTAPEVYAATAATCDDWLKRRAGVPSLGDVASRIAAHT